MTGMRGSAATVDAGNSPGARMLHWLMAYKLSDLLMELHALGVLARLGREAATTDVLAAELGLHEAGLGRALALLTLAGIVEDEGSGRYRLPSDCRDGLALVTLESRVREWHIANRSLASVLATGRGGDPMDGATADFVEAYGAAMAGSKRAVALAVARLIDLSGTRNILDIGGSDGALIALLAARAPQARLTVADRTVVAPLFAARMEKAGLAERACFVACNLRKDADLGAVAASADVAILSNLLHMLDTGARARLLTALHHRLPEGARVVVYDQFVRPSQTVDAAALMTIDWVNCGSMFDLDETVCAAELRDCGFSEAVPRRLAMLPGAFVVATA